MKLTHITAAAGLFFAFLAVSLPTTADEALYGKVPPADAAFFRFVNASDKPLEIHIDGKKAATLTPRDISPFGFMSAGDMPFELNGVAVDISLNAGEQVSFVWHEKGEMPYTLIHESQFDNKKKARVRLYNLTGHADLDLKTADGKHQVIAGVQPQNKGHRDVNAVRLPFSAVGKGQILATTDPIALSRDKATSIFAFEDNDDVLLTIKHTER